jgi:hypothetical protein
MDSELCQSYGYLFLLLAEVIRQFLTIFAAMPVMIPAIFPLIILCVFVSVSSWVNTFKCCCLKRYFNAASAQFRRIASNSMSTVCSSVQDAYCGASSIRVFDVMQRFRNQFARNLDHTVESNSVEVIGKF